MSFALRDRLPMAEVRAANDVLSLRFEIKKYPTLLVLCKGDPALVSSYRYWEGWRYMD